MKRLLVISNTAMNKSTANGRTLVNLLYGFAPENLAQFYIKEEPDYSCCDHYYHISDNMALKAVFNPLFRKSIKGKVFPCDTSEGLNSDFQPSRKIKKSCRNKYLRSLIWSTKRWWTADFEKFLDDFSPQAVLLYAGDAPFMYDIAIIIAQKRRIPLFMYNCENYVLKDTMYASAKKYSVWHLLLKQLLKTKYSRIMKEVKFCFYITEYLEKKYQVAYPHPGKSHAIYTAANMEDYRSERIEPNCFTLLYCGNLGIGRPPALLSLANVLYSVDPTAKLKIFGKFLDEESEELLTNCPNVEFGGRIPYEQVLEETKKCSMVIHCENPDRVKNLECGFSTKLADCLSCGIPMLVYAVRDYPFVQYLEKHNVAHIAENEAELRNILSECIKNKSFREEFVPNALILADKNHNLKKNGDFVKNIICDKNF